MEFNYGLEFYYSETFSIKNPKLFEKRVREAKEVDRYFSSLGIDIENVRPYILYAYKFNKNYGTKNIIRYVKGLIYATDYINFKDLENVNDDFKLIEEITCDDGENESLWEFTGFQTTMNTENFIEENDDELINSIDTSNNTFEIDSKTYDKLLNLANEDTEETTEEEIEEDIPIDYISVSDKLNLFRSKADNYIKVMIEAKINEGMIDNSDVKVVKKAMKDWFDIMFTRMQDLVDINEKILKYNDKNVIKYL